MKKARGAGSQRAVRPVRSMKDAEALRISMPASYTRLTSSTIMIAVTGKKLSELYREICGLYGELAYAEASFTMTNERKAELQHFLFEELRNPDFDDVDHSSREDGCKVYFKDGSWVICRFSGTEPLLRMAAEAETKEKAEGYINTWKKFLSL